MTQKYQPNWRSLRQHTAPQWFRDAKFGIYTHWGIYSVPAIGPNTSWYGHDMYRGATEQHAAHVKRFGPVEEFGYKDFIPQFTAEKFEADQWAEVFQNAGARFAKGEFLVFLHADTLVPMESVKIVNTTSLRVSSK